MEFKQNKFIRIGFYLFIFFLPFMNILTFEVGLTLKISDIIALVMIVALSFQIFASYLKNKEIKTYLSKVSLPLVLFILACFLSTIQTVRVPIKDFGLRDTVGRNTPYLRSITQAGWAMFSYLIFLLTLNVVTGKKVLIQVLRIYLISSFLACLYGLYQLIGHLLGLDTGLKFTSAIWVAPRMNATFGEPILLANFLLSAIPLSLVIFLDLNEERIFNKFISGVFLVIFFICFSLAFSFSSWIALAAGLTCLLFLNHRYLYPKKILKMISLLLIIGAILTMFTLTLMPSFGRALRVSFDKLGHYKAYSQMSIKSLKRHPSACSQQERIWLWKAAANMFKAHPLLGVGVGNFGFHYNEYRPKDAEYKGYLTLANNQYLEILAETGIIGMACFLYFIFRFIRLFINGLKNNSDYVLKAILAAFSAIFIGWAIQYSFLSTLYIIYIWVMLGLSIATVRLILNE